MSKVMLYLRIEHENLTEIEGSILFIIKDLLLKKISFPEKT